MLRYDHTHLRSTQADLFLNILVFFLQKEPIMHRSLRGLSSHLVLALIMAIALVMSVFHIPAHATETENTTGDATLTEMPLVEEPAVSPAQVESDQATLTEEPGVLAEQLPAAPADDTHAHPTERFATVEQHNAAKPSTCQSDGKIRPEEITKTFVKAVNEDAPLTAWKLTTIGFELALNPSVKHCAGDTITIQPPKQVSPGGEEKRVQIQPEGGVVFADAIFKNSGDIIVTLNENVENPDLFNFKGGAVWEKSLRDVELEVGTVNLVWTVEGTIISTNQIEVAPCEGCGTISPSPQKWGSVSSAGELVATFSTPLGTMDNQEFEFEDLLDSSNQWFECKDGKMDVRVSTYSRLNQWGTALDRKDSRTQIDCDRSSVRFTVTADKGWKTQVYVPIKVDPKDPGPWSDTATVTTKGQAPKQLRATIARLKASGYGSYENREVVTPGKPTVKGEATCVNGVSGAKIVIPATANVKYSINDKPASAGEHPMPTGNVTVTAVATDPSKYVLEGETIWRFTNKDCPKPIKPEKPTITGGAACEGIVSDAKIIIPASDHLRYKIDGKPARVGENPVGNRTSVTVTAELIDPTKHTLEGESSWTFTVKDCPKPVTPEKPVQKGSVNCIDCATAPRQQAMIVIPNTPGVEYRVNDKVLTPGEHELASGESVVTVDAIDPSKTVLEGTTQWIFTVEDCSCPKPPSTPKPEPKPNGSSEAGIGILVFLAVAVPLVALLLHHIPMIKQWLPQPPAQKPANPEQKPSAPAKGMPKKGVEKKGIAK